ncbi:MAG TPA: iron ABC transporter permease [Syntrophorhabdaceae bacterium]|jgi:iron complex transport system permease protein|nr:iron ABC transporter permease [Syntrophorhabdaceae bacterium]MDI9562257.1 iron ABC transporter permease [Pseudomonadota bacterium]OQC49081.1 MAG: Hemin transport system permease protein HmuU [Deltaproteobacteria bacterium ADurb.Bin026]MBV6504683.1 Hemin transport system permease protein HmuU [Syntrophorhabdaceae bacterium]HNQ63566.1 iron ABC transporter permease [Syntrophorhabdaceae bacterium]
MKNRLSRWTFSILISSAFLVAAGALSLCIGSAGIPITKIISILLDGRGTSEYSILVDIRLPRIILGFAIGGALSLAGVILQGMFRNPLVEPYTLGISGGAALGTSICIILKLNRLIPDIAMPLSGFIGALLVILLVYFINTRRGIFMIQGLLLTGVMISFISSSLVILILAISRTEDLHGIIFWIMGSLEEPNWVLIWVATTASLACLAFSYLFCLDMNALSLGEEEAIHLGVDVEKKKKLLFLIASILTGISVSVTGLIGFVGLIVPHFMRMFVGFDHRILLLSSFLAGAGFLIFCDMLARIVIAPIELPVGVITGIIGGSIFIYALNKRSSF